MVYFYNYFDTGKDSEDETTTMVTGAGIVAAGAGDEPKVGAATVRLREKTRGWAQKRIDSLNDRFGMYCQFCIPRNLQFLHYFHHMTLVNVKLDTSKDKGILFGKIGIFVLQ